MATIKEMMQRWASLEIETETAIIIEQTADQAIAFNQRKLYTQGVDKMGVPLAPYFQPGYKKFKEQLNPGAGGKTDLYLTGAWYRSMYLETTATTFQIKSTDEKDEELRAKYGDDIEGLTAEDKVEYGNEVVHPGLMNYIRNVTKC